MTDIYDAIARGFRYPARPEKIGDSEVLWDEELDDDYDEIPPAPLALGPAQRASLRKAVDAGLGERAATARCAPRRRGPGARRCRGSHCATPWTSAAASATARW